MSVFRTPEEGRSPTTVLDFVRGLSEGDDATLTWLRRRVRRQAAPRFSRWAWSWIQEDFTSDLVLQLLKTMRRPEFELRGSLNAYVDVSISNLCRHYFTHLARVRREKPLEPDTVIASPTPRSWERRVLEAMRLRRLLRSVSSDCRRLLTDKYASGLSLKEIARRCRIEPKTVRSRLHVCREHLRTAYRSEEGSRS